LHHRHHSAADEMMNDTDEMMRLAAVVEGVGGLSNDAERSRGQWMDNREFDR